MIVDCIVLQVFLDIFLLLKCYFGNNGVYFVVSNFLYNTSVSILAL